MPRLTDTAFYRSALYGPLHGGANEAVIRMLLDIGSPENVPAYIEKVKTKEKVLSGFGHRIYRTSDPRSFIIRKTAEEVFAVTGRNPLLETALTLHDIALKDEYFVKRRLYPNVDFFSGLIYQSLGFVSETKTIFFYFFICPSSIVAEHPPSCSPPITTQSCSPYHEWSAG